MTNIIKFKGSKNMTSEIVTVCPDKAVDIFESFFDIESNINDFGCSENGYYITANLKQIGNDAIVENACNIFMSLYAKSRFNDVADMVLLFMDCMAEAEEVDFLNNLNKD